MSLGATATGLRHSGFLVATHHSTDDNTINIRIGVPSLPASVHNATAANDVMEGHVSSDPRSRPMVHRQPVTGLAVLGIAGESSGRGSAPMSSHNIIAF